MEKKSRTSKNDQSNSKTTKEEDEEVIFYTQIYL